jgi:hypothetical protein
MAAAVVALFSWCIRLRNFGLDLEFVVSVGEEAVIVAVVVEANGSADITNVVV